MEITSAVAAVLGAFGLSGAAGLNAWLPLLAVGAADRFGWIELGDAYSWLSSTPALIVLAVVFLFDLVGDKIPAIDSVLHGFGTLVAPASGAILFAAETSLSSQLPPAVAAVLGAVTAGSVHAGRSVARPFVTGTTGGVGNPVVSTAEDGTSLALTVLALAVPVVAFIAVVILLIVMGWLAFRAARWLRGRRGRQDRTDPQGSAAVDR
ncbi:DUF4126 domain-containing protein [Nocardia sp. 2]|uniref:DUF4126 domain-containing protein n=1 Tax=Nocardia acididurans TaxID=2802282 RepID=A0ABS1M7C4_9NOCA|nr:DUF4126 domain-containing protein [Nocardia acididurans]MBL1076547.1 DUF4126 domain-containing protein [Nocardia acididurans]